MLFFFCIIYHELWCFYLKAAAAFYMLRLWYDSLLIGRWWFSMVHARVSKLNWLPPAKFLINMTLIQLDSQQFNHHQWTIFYYARAFALQCKLIYCLYVSANIKKNCKYNKDYYNYVLNFSLKVTHHDYLKQFFLVYSKI